MQYRLIFSFLMAVLLAVPAMAQSLASTGLNRNTGPFVQAPAPFQILGLTVEGIDDESMKTFVLQSSGLTIGQEVTIPGDEALAKAIRNIYNLKVFSDVKIMEDRRAGEGVFLAIRVKEEPRLGDYSFQGIKKRHRDDIKKEIPLLKGTRVREGDLERSKQVIREFYQEKGYLLADVDVAREVTGDNKLNLTFNVDRGQKVEVEDIVVIGNADVSDRAIRKTMETDRDKWWKFWKSARFDKKEFEEDLNRVVDLYNKKGFYDARVVSDSVYMTQEGGDPGVVVQLRVHEGPKYHIRSVNWDGNTVFTDEALNASLGLDAGDTYNSAKLEENLYANQRATDVSSLYLNRGHMRFNVQPTIEVADGDSLDILFEVYEGEVYEFGDITIAGNTKTKEHVIRRELYTVPGQTFSRDSIQETIRRLSQLNYFEQQSLAAGPGINIDEEDKEVDLTYTVAETSSDQLELSGTYGRFGLVLQLRFSFNNFSLQDTFKKDSWRPLPSGDGQKLSVSLQTNGTFYQSYSLGYTEPWFRGRATPIGFNVSHSRYSRDPTFNSNDERTDNKFITTAVDLFYRQRLQWPDDKFSSSLGLGYQYFDNDNLIGSLPNGLSQEVALKTGLSRNSQNHPLFPTSGSNMNLSLDVALPLPDFIQYHKWRFNTGWHLPLTQKLTLSLGTDYGYIGTLTGEEVDFERFVVGGSPFDSQGFNDFFGKDVVYMRGYPARVLGPRLGGNPTGGRILNKYTSEIRWLAVQSQQLQAAPYLFLDAANTWDGFDTYNPAQLFRSAGVGARLFLPILGMLELTYGYNFDEFEPFQNNNHNGSNRWLFQFSLGQGFGQ